MAELDGLRILVTRPRDQALQLSRDIEREGGMPLLFPLLEIMPVPDRQTLHQQLERLDGVDLAIFISPNAVAFGVAAMREVGVIPARVATVGMGSAKALRELGFNDVIVPASQFDSEGLLALPELQAVAGKHIAIFRGDGGRALLGDTMTARGANVEYVTCYLRSKPKLDPSELVQADAVIVTSSEALTHLREISQGSLSDTALFVPHPRIAELARKQGWREIRLTDAGDEGIIAGLLEWAADRMHDSEKVINER